MTLSANDEAKYEQIEKLHMEGIIYTEKRCRKLCMSQLPWSSNLQYVQDRINLWKYIIKKIEKFTQAPVTSTA